MEPKRRTTGRNSLGPSQTNQNADGLEAHTCSLKHMEGSVKWLQEVLERGYEMGVGIAHLDMLRGLEDFKVTLDRVAMAGHWKPEQKKAWED